MRWRATVGGVAGSWRATKRAVGSSGSSSAGGRRARNAPRSSTVAGYRWSRAKLRSRTRPLRNGQCASAKAVEPSRWFRSMKSNKAIPRGTFRAAARRCSLPCRAMTTRRALDEIQGDNLLSRAVCAGAGAHAFRTSRSKQRRRMQMRRTGKLRRSAMPRCNSLFLALGFSAFGRGIEHIGRAAGG